MEKILTVENLHVQIKTPFGHLKAVRGVSFALFCGEVLAIVGESGSGKSVTAKSILRLLPQRECAITDGKIIFRGQDLLELSEKEMRKIRGNQIAMVFQDPMTSLNPTMQIGKQIMEGIILHRRLPKKAKKEAIKLLELVGIRDPVRMFSQYPHELSGGMRQRAVIAMALGGQPDILILDEPTTALDVSVQAQILDLLKQLKQKLGTSFILITHDLGVVSRLADRVLVMYAGKIVEIGTVEDIFYDARHPYTWALFDCVPRINEKKRLASIPGSPPHLIAEPKGDAFAPRNPYALNIDFKKEPPLIKISGTHYARTWLLDERAPKIIRKAEKE